MRPGFVFFAKCKSQHPPVKYKFYVLHQHVYKAVPKLWIFTICGLDGSNGFIYVVALMLATAKNLLADTYVCDNAGVMLPHHFKDIFHRDIREKNEAERSVRHGHC